MSKTETISPRRPLIDIDPDRPLVFRGARIARDGTVYGSTKNAVHGRTNPNYEVPVGSVAKDERGRWYAIDLTGATRARFATQDEAGTYLLRYTEAHQ